MHNCLADKKVILFDLFHTLTALESTWGDNRPFTYQLLEVGKEAWHYQVLQNSPDRLTGKKTDTFEIVSEMARNIDPNITDDLIQRAVENRIARVANALINVPEETLAVLRYFKSQGKTIALISNADAMEAEPWERSPMAAYFDHVFFSCDVGYAKPDLRIYRLCLDTIGIDAADAVFIGDGGSNELHGAQQVGLTTIMITGIISEFWPEKVPERRQHADYEIEWLGELISS